MLPGSCTTCLEIGPQTGLQELQSQRRGSPCAVGTRSRALDPDKCAGVVVRGGEVPSGARGKRVSQPAEGGACDCETIHDSGHHELLVLGKNLSEKKVMATMCSAEVRGRKDDA